MIRMLKSIPTREEKATVAIETLKDLLRDLETGVAEMESMELSAEVLSCGSDSGYYTYADSGQRTMKMVYWAKARPEVAK